MVSIKKADLEAVALGTHPDFLALIERSRARQRAEGGISSVEILRGSSFVSLFTASAMKSTT